MKIVIAGGGTAGHIMPAIEVAKAVRKKKPDAEFLWIGSKNGMEKDLVTRAGFEFKSVATGKMRRYFSLKNISDSFQIPLGILQAGGILSVFRPNVVFSKGGYVSAPTVVAAWMQNIPILSHESDIVPGLANRKLEFFTTKIGLSFPDLSGYFKKDKTFVAGFPVRHEIFEGDKKRALDLCHFSDPARPVLLVMGGSQGAVRINDAVVQILPELSKKFNTIHITGDFQHEEIASQTKQFASEGSYRAFPYIYDEMPDVLSAADVVVSRAGATSIFELAALHKRMLLIPLEESANDHQHENAVAFAEAGIAQVLVEKNLESHILYKNILDLLFNTKEADIQEAAKKVIHVGAAETMAEWLVRLSHYGRHKIKN